MANMPKEVFGESMVVTGAKDWFEGKGENRRRIGTKYVALALFDACAPITISVKDLEPSVTQEVLTDRNGRLDFVKARFSGLAVQYSGGDFGAINYRGTADSVGFLNLAAPTGGSGREAGK